MSEPQFSPDEIADCRFYLIRLCELGPLYPGTTADEKIEYVHPEDKERFLRGRDAYLKGCEVEEDD